MESRTSPGKSGSVQPLSEYLMDVFRSSLVLVSRPVGRGEKDSSSIGLGECVAPDQIVAWEERISLRPLLRSFCPGYPALPVVPLPVSPLQISSTAFVICGLP